MENPYEPIPARLVDVIPETPTIKTFVLEPEQPVDFRAGQFVQITLPGVGEAPFTPSSSPRDKDKLEVTILKTGKITDRLHDVPKGETLGVRGPFGQGYPIDKFLDQDILLVGGGVGLAPLRSLIYEMTADVQRFKRVSIKYGARLPDELLFRRQFDEWRAVDRVDFTETIDKPAEGWTGQVGLVTELLSDLDLDVNHGYMVSCGPSIMLRFVTLRALEVGYSPEQIYLSMNRRMSCGIGKCGRCNIGPYYLCKDGPDMCYAKIKDYPNVFA